MIRLLLGGSKGCQLEAVKALWRNVQRRADGAAYRRRAAAAERTAAAARGGAVAVLGL